MDPIGVAEAEGLDEVFEPVLAALRGFPEVGLARIWLLDDRDCPICAASRQTPPAGILHLRATGEQPAPAASPAGVAGDHHLIPVAGASRLAGIVARGKPSMSSTVQPLDRWGLEPTRAG